MEQRISIERLEQAINLFGSFDENIRLIESEFHVTVANREGELRVNGEPEDTMLACKALSALLTLSNRGEAINEQNVRYVIGLARSGQEEKIGELTQDVICISAKGRPIKPKTIGQKEYVDSISQNTVTIGVGPAGTGKTYLAVVHGEPDALQGTYRDLLRRDPNERKTYVTDKMAKGVQEAVLDYDVLGTRTELSLVRIYLQTGRTHQIRCQFSARGLPLWGDKKYSTLPDDGPIALWSHCLHFAHPDTGEVLYFEQQPPDISPWSLFAD